MLPEEYKVQSVSEEISSVPALPIIKIIFVGGQSEEFLMYKQMLSSAKYGASYVVSHLSEYNEFDEYVNKENPNLIILDLSSSEDGDFKFFRKFHKKHPLLPKIIFTDFMDESVGLKAIRAGAEDYMVKEVISSFALNRSIQYAIERNQIEKSLWDSNKAMKEFSSTAAHDLKSPLATIISYMDLIKNSEDINKEEIISIIGKIDRSANRMNKLISDLLKYAEIENRLIKISKVDLNSLFKNISEDTNSSQYLRCDGLPKIDGDETQIYQLFKNIIENALKFTRPGCSPEIVVYARPMPGFSKFAEIMISDNGIGIEKENFDKIFNAFSRVSNNYQGTGIGLATCKRIVSNHKGKISLKSKFGEGTTFIVTLPINQF